jgi:pimeloyl-ACP methyl ester carboxylesterase
MFRPWRIVTVVVLVGVIGLVGYTGYIGYEGSRRLVVNDGWSRDCRTPDVLFGWEYEAMNYDIADDAELRVRNADLSDCEYQGAKAGDEIVTEDGVRIAGWYVPAASGVGPTGPTVILVHGFTANKSGILRYGTGLHEDFNLVAYDSRNIGRSTGDATTGGVLERQDLRAVIDWLERTKGPEHIGVLGNSLGAATGLAEAVDDPRVEALGLDSMHTRVSYQIEARVSHGGYPSYVGTTWAILLGIWLRTGADLPAIDAEEIIGSYGERPLLIIHGEADGEDLPERTQSFYHHAMDEGTPTEIHWCPGSGHLAPGMPVDVCAGEFATWTSEFFSEALDAGDSAGG